MYIYFLIYSLFIYIYIYIYRFFTGIFQTDMLGNVEFRDNSFSAPSVGWWLRHGSDSSRSQLGLQPGDRDFSVVVPNGNRHRHVTIIAGGPQKPICRWDYGALINGPKPKKMGK